jgi:myo-inositol-1(or 4)-monophosphatase
VSHLSADARATILPHFRSAFLTTDNKLAGGYDPVTEADQNARCATFWGEIQMMAFW